VRGGWTWRLAPGPLRPDSLNSLRRGERGSLGQILRGHLEAQQGSKRLLACKARASRGRRQCRVFAQRKVREWRRFTSNVLDAYRPETLARHPLAPASADVSRLRTLRREGQLHVALGATTFPSRLLLDGGVALVEQRLVGHVGKRKASRLRLVRVLRGAAEDYKPDTEQKDM
jgi:hypothetical protein